MSSAVTWAHLLINSQVLEEEDNVDNLEAERTINLSVQDGPCPPPEDVSRHEDSPSYRRAAIRELFEESGILLAKNRHSSKMIAVDEPTREAGRRLIHQNKSTFDEWLKQQDAHAEPDIGE